jgi:hypothetical protein
MQAGGYTERGSLYTGRRLEGSRMAIREKPWHFLLEPLTDLSSGPTVEACGCANSSSGNVDRECYLRAG